MSTPQNKRKRTTQKKQKQLLSSKPQWSLLNPSLPYDLLLDIVARVPRLYHPTLSLVSKTFRSLLASPELYKVRSHLGLRESCLYVCFDMLEGPTWFTLCRKPDQINKEERSGYALAKVPIPNSPNVRIDPNYNYISNTACFDGKFNVTNLGKAVAYDPKEGRWDIGPNDICGPMISGSYCEIENVLYAAVNGDLRWYDSQGRQWRYLKGLVGLPKIPNYGRTQVRLADYGGKLVVMWDDFVVPSHCGFKTTTVFFAEVALERLNSFEIWGKVEWVDRLLTIFDDYYLVKVIAATV
ncbi:PREDICTED: F-box/kelch-repeat protein At5g51250-like [Camelina sativa]|uniref:F-box/kelch-repeat protein At5g51250-like n=1 Tax=Camelina sativa TaxID=90675 RepID=A0ABM0T5S7_CAMSA|nr:PREDICTED: F-box/kelch-repeat protein At5g51250-like [Camelina sativa]